MYPFHIAIHLGSRRSVQCCPFTTTASVQQPSMKTVRVLFLRSTATDHWINRTVSYWDPPFCHVEIEFEVPVGRLPHDGYGIPSHQWGQRDHNAQGTAASGYPFPGDIPCAANMYSSLPSMPTVTESDKQHTCVASSVYNGETVFMKQRRFANPNYTIISLLVSDTQFKKMYAFCEHRTASSVAFNQTAMVCAFCPFLSKMLCRTSVETGPDTFCSEHVTLVLQAGNIPEVSQHLASTVTPSRLYKLLANGKTAAVGAARGKRAVQCFSTVDYKIDLMERVGTV